MEEEEEEEKEEVAYLPDLLLKPRVAAANHG